MTSNPRRLLQRFVDAPEVNVVLFAFLLNYPWEFLQAPFFQDVPTAPHWGAVKVCTRATLGDAAVMLLAFWAAAATVRSRRWILHPTLPTIFGFIAVGLAVTVVLERLATGALNQWTYAPAMPVVPVLEVGLLPLLQWALLPPIVTWFVRRQLS